MALRVATVPRSRIVARLDHFADMHVVNPGLKFTRQAISANDELTGFKAMDSQDYLPDNWQWET